MKDKFNYDLVAKKLRKKQGGKVVMSEDGAAYLRFRHGLLHLAVPVASKRAPTILTQLVREHLKIGITKAQAKGLLEMLEGVAMLTPGKPVQVFRRVGEVKGATIVLLDADAGLVAKIKDSAVKVRKGSGCTFYFSGNAKPLPEPDMDADPLATLEECHGLTSLSKTGFNLFILFILCSYSPYGPYLVGIILGESGTAKSMLVKMFKHLIDPEKTLTRNLPANERDLNAAAMNAHVIAYDNVSALPPKISDAICRTSSGGGSTRSMGRGDEDELVFWACRVYLLNGIDNFVARDDLIQRSVRFHTNRIEQDQRDCEREIWRKFERLRPKLLGVIFKAIAHGLGHFHEVDLSGKLPRMADMIKWAVAAGGYFGWSADRIVRAFEENQHAAFVSYAETDLVVAAVLTLVHRKGEIKCSPTELHFRLGEIVKGMGKTLGRSIKDYPPTPSALGSRLRRSAEALKMCGVEYSTSATHEGRMVHLRLTKKDGEA